MRTTSIIVSFLSFFLYPARPNYQNSSDEPLSQEPTITSLWIPDYEATTSRRTRSLAKELITGAVASFFLMAFQDYAPLMVMLLVQAVGAGMNILYGLAIDGGMSICVLIIYRQMFAAISTIVLALWQDNWIGRGAQPRPVITMGVFWMTLGLAVFGAFLSPLLFTWGLGLTSPIYVSAVSNLVPGFTFILVAIFRIEPLALGTRPGRFKVIGTIISTFGALLITFYKGPKISFWDPLIKIDKPSPIYIRRSNSQKGFGVLAALASAILDAAVFVMMGVLNRSYNFHHSCTTSAMMNTIGVLCCLVLIPFVGTDPIVWRMGWDIRLFTTSYTGIIISGLVAVAFLWCSRLKGSVYPVMFRPVTMMLVGLLGSLILPHQPIRLESLLGGLFIVGGLWLFLYGKKEQEEEAPRELDEEAPREPDEEAAAREPEEDAAHYPDAAYHPDAEEHRGSSATLIAHPQEIEMI